jgi:small nuclear ribonucleoprotein (snRNP)-like protein
VLRILTRPFEWIADILFAVIGTLKGYDQLMNLVLDEVKEAMTGTLISLPSIPNSPHPTSDSRFQLTHDRRRRRQRPVAQARPHRRARNTPRRHLPRRRQRGDRKSLPTRGGMRRSCLSDAYDLTYDCNAQGWGRRWGLGLGDSSKTSQGRGINLPEIILKG